MELFSHILAFLTPFEGYIEAASLLLYFPACIALAFRRDHLQRLGRKAPDIYFLPQSPWMRSHLAQERLYSGFGFFFKFWDLGSDDWLFRILVVLWRAGGVLFAVGAISMFMGKT